MQMPHHVFQVPDIIFYQTRKKMIMAEMDNMSLLLLVNSTKDKDGASESSNGIPQQKTGNRKSI